MPRLALTDRFVAGAKTVDAPQTDYFDSKTPGLTLRVSASTRAWSFVFTSPKDGRRARMALGTYPALGLAEARTRATEARGLIHSGTDPREALTPQGTAEITVAALAELYLANPEKAALRSVKEIERRLRRNALPIIGAIKAAKLTRRDMRNVLDPITQRGAQRQAGLTFKDIRALLRWATKEEYLQTNPLAGMDEPSGSTPRERTLSDDEIRTLWLGLPIMLPRSPSCQRIIKLILATGQRSGEVAGIRRSELDLTRKLWSLPGARTKNAHEHSVPLSDLAIKIVREQLASSINDDEKFLFPGEINGGSLTSQTLARTIGRAHETDDDRPHGRFGIAPFSAHDLRRTALTNLARLGTPPHVIAHVANHRSLTKSGVTFAHYVMHFYEGEKRSALDSWGERLEAIVGQGASADILPLRVPR
jgi:integrase